MEIRHGLAERAEQSRVILVISWLQNQNDPQNNLTKNSYWSLWLLHKHSSSLAFNFTEGNQVPELIRRCPKMKQRLPWSHRLALHQHRPTLWSSGQSFWLQIQRSRVRFPALPDFLSSSVSGTGSTQPREVNWGTTWIKSSGSGPENRD